MNNTLNVNSLTKINPDYHVIPQSTIDEILSLDITEVIGRYMKLTRNGSSHKGCCPFHQEKTPSFSVSPSKGIYKCFGCGKSGNAIGFMMEFKKSDFVDAVKAIANDHNITIPVEKQSEEEDEKYKHREALYHVNKLAAGYFMENLSKNDKALEYVGTRWNDDVIGDFQIGYAPDGWDNFKKWAKDQGIKEAILLEAGLLIESKGKVFDYFRNRIIFPIMNRTGRVVGFTGRDFSGDENAPKYFNTKETEIYTKGKVLYGYHSAYISIKEKKFAYLVEGNPDVIRMHQIGKLNTVGTCGTSLTTDQITEIKKHTGSVTIIGDSDKAGEAAVIRNGKMLNEAGIFCNVISLPKDEKHDPDSFFTDVDQFSEYNKDHNQDFIIILAASMLDSHKDPHLKSELIEKISRMVTNLPQNTHAQYIERLCTIVKPKKIWQDQIKHILNDEPKEEQSEIGIPANISLSDWEKYGFYEYEHKYYFKTKNGPVRGCNFTMEPLFHIASVMNAKRLYKITNEYGFSQVIELLQRDLISLANFKLRVESLGNFLFEGTETDLNKLKRFLYEKTQSCFEIVQLGWQRQGFWAWCNGIYDGKFTETDHNGIVAYKNENFYLPASSDIYKGEDSLFISERKFRYRPGKITLNDYSQKLIDVFGENAIYGICFYLACLFRDHIVNLFGFFPILNLFGPKGTGKTELSISLMQFFGHQSKGPNITNTTKAALADHVALFSNSCCHIDEYKNNLEYEKIEFLKGLWDGTGRTRMNMDKDKKKETTHVDCGIFLSGQDMPTADIALFSRLIFLGFNKVEYTDDEKINFNNLKEIEKLGISHITHEMLSHRKYFIDNFLDNYKLASDELTATIGNTVIEDRIFRNWLVILAAYRTLKDVIVVPWEYRKLLKNAASLIILQNRETKNSNELSIFWQRVEYFAQEGLIKEGVDFKLELTDKLTSMENITDGKIEWRVPKNVLFLNHSRVFQLYLVQGSKTKENTISIKTLEYYLMNCKEYIGKKHGVIFKVEDNKRIIEDKEISVNVDGKSQFKITRRSTNAFCFDYDLLHISIKTDEKTVVIDESGNPKEDDLPF